MAVLKSINEPGATSQSITGALKSINEPNTTLTSDVEVEVRPAAEPEVEDPDDGPEEHDDARHLHRGTPAKTLPHKRRR
jgi:hypothetical protein